MRFKLAAVLLATLAFTGCKKKKEPQMREPVGSGSAAAAPKKHDAIARADFNRVAVYQNLPVYWTADANNNNTLDPDEVATLRFYDTSPKWVDGGKFTPAFESAYDKIVAESKAKLDESTDDGKRRALVRKDLDAGRPSLVRTDFTNLSADDKKFAEIMLAVGDQIDDLYEQANGATALAAKLPADPESRSLFRRNRGPKCVGPATEKDPACSAIPGSPPVIFDIYPADIQAKEDFCQTLEARKDSDTLMGHFNVVKGEGDKLEAVAYHDAYKEHVTKIAQSLNDAAKVMTDPNEKPLVAYLEAAATAFLTDDWKPADEAWAKMNVDNSKWYVRVAPDETYWEPCAHKAGYHLTFARINQGSKAWQDKLVPVQQEMEDLIAKQAGAPYKARKVTFHLPDFIDIVINAGDDRDPLGATIGQSLPNWGPVANEGRGRTVAMVNINTDPDSRAARKQQMESVFDAESAKLYPESTEPGLLSTILHEATHNLGPAHEYEVKGKKADVAFGGPIASMMEELKAQTGALFLTEFLREKNIITAEQAQQSVVDSIVWAFGHTSQGMYAGDGSRKAYGNLAAIQLGYLIDNGALTWDANATAANGTDKGAFTIHADKLVPVVAQLMKEVGGIKARGDKAAAEKLIARYVDSEQVVPHKLIAERFLRHAKPSFVYSVSM